jgi:hypothetical protein
MFGVSGRTWSTWEESGRVTCGRYVSVPGKPGQQKVYAVDALRHLQEAFENPPAFPPAGFVGRDEACGMFGVSLSTWMAWERQRRITCGRFVSIPGKSGRCKIYPIDELERLRAEFKREDEESARRLQPYPDPERPGCWRVPVATTLHAGMEAIIDGESLPLVEGKRWNWTPGKREGEGSVVIAGGGSPRPSLHQMVTGVNGREYRVGHLNGDPLDCRKENLVVRTFREQAAAARKPLAKAGRVCASRYKGVSLAESGRKWKAVIAVAEGGRQHRAQLGHFRSEIDAALAYDHAAREIYGEHARLNLPDPEEVKRLRAKDTPFEPIYDAYPPAGWMERDDAAAMFGVSIGTWGTWDSNGRIACGKYFPLPDEKPGRCRLYPIEELERLREEISALGKPYPDPDRPGCYRVPLKGYLTYREAIIDAESLGIVEGRNWNWALRVDGCYEGQVILATVSGPNSPLARLIAGVLKTDERVTFANGDPLDCRRENIVVKTLAEQVRGNRKSATRAGRPCTSRFKGVSWSEGRGKWVAQITKGEVYRQLGRFDEEIDAAEAYDKAARELFGEHAWLNFPSEGERGCARNDSASTRAAA